MIIITGGAGFIGSHLVDKFIEKGEEVVVIDNFEFSGMENLREGVKILNHDISKESFVEDVFDKVRGAKAIFHYAADPDVRRSKDKPKRSFEINVKGTYNVLELARKLDSDFVFASTSAVYGRAKVIPTPESAEIKAESNYGASKIAGEAYTMSFSNTYGIRATILRYANIFGDRSTHGVMFDFFHKLKKDREKLEILGNGMQEKSYLYIKDAVNATLLAYEKQDKKLDVFNIGSEEKLTVREIAKEISSYLGLNPSFEFTSNENIGWKGDVPLMMLSIEKIKALGFKPEYSVREGIRKYMDWLKERYGF